MLTKILPRAQETTQTSKKQGALGRGHCLFVCTREISKSRSWPTTVAVDQPWRDLTYARIWETRPAPSASGTAVPCLAPHAKRRPEITMPGALKELEVNPMRIQRQGNDGCFSEVTRRRRRRTLCTVAVIVAYALAFLPCGSGFLVPGAASRLGGAVCTGAGRSVGEGVREGPRRRAAHRRRQAPIAGVSMVRIGVMAVWGLRLWGWARTPAVVVLATCMANVACVLRLWWVLLITTCAS